MKKEFNRTYKCDNCGGPVKTNGTGLKTWHCENNCRKRRVDVQRYIGSGKEKDGKIMSITVRRPIKVKVQLREVK